ncbi:unnamed protein product [marine sediment metagenome]|uniref:Uncharacterized protein n=1 Tax=marine sediment metagenome TaxID=412755 RepID=X1UDD9_9ZZZZ
MAEFVYEKYKKDRCLTCIRRTKCSQSHEAILLCAVCSFNKNQDSPFITPEEKEQTESDIEDQKGE